MYIWVPATQQTQPSSESLNLLDTVLSGHPFILLSIVFLSFLLGDGA